MFEWCIVHCIQTIWSKIMGDFWSSITDKALEWVEESKQCGECCPDACILPLWHIQDQAMFYHSQGDLQSYKGFHGSSSSKYRCDKRIQLYSCWNGVWRNVQTELHILWFSTYTTSKEWNQFLAPSLDEDIQRGTLFTFSILFLVGNGPNLALGQEEHCSMFYIDSFQLSFVHT